MIIRILLILLSCGVLGTVTGCYVDSYYGDPYPYHSVAVYEGYGGYSYYPYSYYPHSYYYPYGYLYRSYAYRPYAYWPYMYRPYAYRHYYGGRYGTVRPDVPSDNQARPPRGEPTRPPRGAPSQPGPRGPRFGSGNG
jgi:hypothetical protein